MTTRYGQWSVFFFLFVLLKCEKCMRRKYYVADVLECLFWTMDGREQVEGKNGRPASKLTINYSNNNKMQQNIAKKWHNDKRQPMTMCSKFKHVIITAHSPEKAEKYNFKFVFLSLWWLLHKRHTEVNVLITITKQNKTKPFRFDKRLDGKFQHKSNWKWVPF